MNKINTLLNNLEKEIRKISNPQERELSQTAFINPFFNHKNRYRSDLQIISTHFKKGRILEIGSSPYHLTYCLQKLGYDVIGIDIDTRVLKKFQEENNLKVIKCDIERDKLPFSSEQFDFIVFNEVFEHLRLDPLKTLREVYRVLKKGGLIMLTTPNLYSLHKIARFNLGGSFNNPLEEFKKVEAFGYMGHIREYSNKEVKELLIYVGFIIKKTIYRKYNNFYNHPYLQFMPLKLLAYLLDRFMDLIPSLKPFQIVISTKE